MCLQILTSTAIPVSIDDRESLIKAANTSLGSKIVSQYSNLLSPMAVDCLMKIVDPERPELLDLKDIRVRSFTQIWEHLEYAHDNNILMSSPEFVADSGQGWWHC